MQVSNSCTALGRVLIVERCTMTRMVRRGISPVCYDTILPIYVASVFQDYTLGSSLIILSSFCKHYLGAYHKMWPPLCHSEKGRRIEFNCDKGYRAGMCGNFSWKSGRRNTERKRSKMAENRTTKRRNGNDTCLPFFQNASETTSEAASIAPFFFRTYRAAESSTYWCSSSS